MLKGARAMQRYHYTECGLDNVILEGVTFVKDADGEETICIPRINQLHKVIAKGIINRPAGMSGKELRFLRTEMGMTQAQLAELLHRDAQSIARWEKGEVEIDGNAETVVRLLASEKLGIEREGDIEALARKSVARAGAHEIIIEKTKDNSYRLKVA